MTVDELVWWIEGMGVIERKREQALERARARQQHGKR
jgi:hypothetical protein